MDTTNATTTILNFAIVKNTSYALALLVSPAYLGLTADSVVIFTTLTILDMVFGIIKSGTLNGWRSIQSNIAQRGLIAKLLILFVPIITALVGRGIGFRLDFLAQSVINVLILSEAYSILGNIYAIRIGKEKNEFDAVAYVLGSIRQLLKRIIIEDSITTDQ